MGCGAQFYVEREVQLGGERKQTSKLDFLPERCLLPCWASRPHKKNTWRWDTRRAAELEKKKTKSNFIDDYVCHLCVREIVLSIYFSFCFGKSLTNEVMSRWRIFTWRWRNKSRHFSAVVDFKEPFNIQGDSNVTHLIEQFYLFH